MTTADDFHRLLDADPSNSEARLIFADWLEEQGDWRAAGYRWMGENGKWPQPPHNLPDGYLEKSWHFWGEKGPPQHSHKIANGLYEDWDFGTRRECEEAICRAVMKLQTSV